MSDNVTFVDEFTDQTSFNHAENFYIGLLLAISSTFLIGSSYVVKKIALLRLEKHGTRAGDGGFGYLNDWMWWLGLILMASGEGANFIAYAYASASLVTPLGGISVIVTAVLSAKFLNDNLNIIGKLGCVVCLSGSTIIVLHAPKEQDFVSLDDLVKKFLSPGFILYAIFIIIISTILICLPHRYGKRNPIVYLMISGLIGSLSVMAAKGVGTAIKESLNSGIWTMFSHWLYPMLIVFLILAIMVQMNYLNKALDLYNTTIVTPILYVIFTGSVLLASTILFREWFLLEYVDWIGNLCGLSCVIVGIFLICGFKDLEISSDMIKHVTSTNHMYSSLPINGEDGPFQSMTKEREGYFKFSQAAKPLRKRLDSFDKNPNNLHRRADSLDVHNDRLMSTQPHPGTKHESFVKQSNDD